MPTLTRQALYDLVWARPMRTVAAELGLSDVGLKKACARADIPVPHRGYWARLAANKAVHQTPLPPRGPGMPEIAFGETHRAYRWPPDPEAELAEPEPVEPVFEETLDSVEARIRKIVGKVSAQPLTNPHPQLRRLIDKDAERVRKYAASNYSWDKPLFDSPFEQRRLRILNTLFWAFTRVSGKPSLSGQVARDTTVGFGGGYIQFKLDHPSAKTNRWDEAQVHGGKIDTLRLEIPALAKEVGHKNVWSDGEGSKLESQLTDIAVMFVLAAEVQYRSGALHSYKYRLESREKARKEVIRLREEAERKERERLIELERQRRERLLGYARDYRAAEDIRAFTSIVATKLEGNEVQQWVGWAREVADRLDPLADLSFMARRE
jgi:hypothetical protein